MHKLLWLSVVIAGCVEPADPWQPEDSLTIETGIYGQTFAPCPDATMPCTLRSAANVAVAAYAGGELPTLQTLPVALAVSGEHGFFQLAVPPGTYRLCRGTQTATSFVPMSCNGAPTWVGGVVRSDSY